MKSSSNLRKRGHPENQGCSTARSQSQFWALPQGPRIFPWGEIQLPYSTSFLVYLYFEIYLRISCN